MFIAYKYHVSITSLKVTKLAYGRFPFQRSGVEHVMRGCSVCVDLNFNFSICWFTCVYFVIFLFDLFDPVIFGDLEAPRVIERFVKHSDAQLVLQHLGLPLIDPASAASSAAVVLDVGDDVPTDSVNETGAALALVTSVGCRGPWCY